MFYKLLAKNNWSTLPKLDDIVTAADTTYRGVYAGVTKSGVKHYIN